MDLKKGEMVLLEPPTVNGASGINSSSCSDSASSPFVMPQLVTLAFSVSLLYLMVQPRPADLPIDNTENYKAPPGMKVGEKKKQKKRFLLRESTMRASGFRYLKKYAIKMIMLQLSLDHYLRILHKDRI